MKSCIRSKMTQRTILLGAAILMTCSFGKSQGFFLNLTSETTTKEYQISTTFSPDTSVTVNNQFRFDEIHRNVSENVEESSTQIVNSVKDIVSLVLDEHAADNQTEENNKHEAVTDSDNDIPSPEALVTNLKLDSNDPPLSIVQIPESDNEDVATALEDSIRSSVKDEIQLEQNFESSAIDNIPDPDVRQTLTEEIMAIDYPQGVKKSDENSKESKQTVANEEGKIESKSAPLEVLTEAIVSDTSQTPNTTVSPVPIPTSTITPVLSTTTVLTTTPIPTTTPASTVNISDIIDDVGAVKAIHVPEVQADTIADAKITTPLIEIFQQITLIPTEEIVHDVVEPQDTLETNPILTRQMRGFSEESETNEISLDNLDSTEKDENSKSESSNSSNSSANSSVSSDSSSKESSGNDENVAAEDKSEDADAAISEDASIEENFEKESPLTTDFIPSTRVTPTPRPAITSTVEVTVVPIEIEGITESSGELLTEPTVMSGDGKHIVMKKPGVDEDISWSNSTGNPESADAPAEDAAQNENPAESAVEARGDVDLVVSYVHNTADTHVVPKVTETLIKTNLSTTFNTPHDDSLVPEKRMLVTDSEIKAIDLDPLTFVTPLENTPRTLKEILDSKTEQAAVPEITETATYIDHKLIQTHIPDVREINTVEGDELFSLVGQDKREDIDDLKSNHTSELVLQTELQSTTPQTSSLTQVSIPERDTIPQISLSTDEQKFNHTTSIEESMEAQSILPGPQYDQQINDDHKHTKASAAILPSQPEIEQRSNFIIRASTTEIASTVPRSGLQITLDSEDVHISSIETSTEVPTIERIEEPSFSLEEAKPNIEIGATSKTNEISKHIDETPLSHTPDQPPTPRPYEEESEAFTYESSTEKPIGRSNDDLTTPALVKTLIEAAELTTEFARHVDSFRTAREETSAISDEIVSPASAGRSFDTINAEGLGKPLPTRSVGDEPSTSSYSSEDKTTTVVVLCSAAGLIFVAFSVAMYLITFQRQHGTLDIEMQEQRCGKDDLEDDDDAETRVTLLNQNPPVDSDEHSFE